MIPLFEHRRRTAGDTIYIVPHGSVTARELGSWFKECHDVGITVNQEKGFMPDVVYSFRLEMPKFLEEVC